MAVKVFADVTAQINSYIETGDTRFLGNAQDILSTEIINPEIMPGINTCEHSIEQVMKHIEGDGYLRLNVADCGFVSIPDIGQIVRLRCAFENPEPDADTDATLLLRVAHIDGSYTVLVPILLVN